jgi:uncharacterized protein YjiS (DUF1127 family)
MFNRISSWLKKSARVRRTVRELANLTDRDLADLGINRSDIHRVANDAVTVSTVSDGHSKRRMSDEEKYIMSQNPQSIRDIEHHARMFQSRRDTPSRVWSIV